MSYCRQVTLSLVRPAIVPAILIFTLFSCRIPVDFPKNKAFVYKSTIKVQGKMKGSVRQDLTSRLQNQLDDSLKTNTVTAFRWAPPFIYKKLPNPPVFDSSNISRSIVFMNTLLNANGYVSPEIRDTVIYDTVNKGKVYGGGKNKGQSKEEDRVYVRFQVKPGKQMYFDSVGYSMETPELQQITMNSRNQSLIKVGEPYSKQVLVNEISRLVDSFHNYGYFRFTKEDIFVEHDTVFSALIDPSLDPLEQAELLEKLKQKKENPTITVVIRQRPARDTTHLMKYYIGKVTVYPDLPAGIEDTLSVHTDTTMIRQIEFITRTDKFKLPFLANNIFLYPGALYQQQNYFHTSNRLSQFSAWEYNNFNFVRSPVNDSLLDVNIFMYPAKKQKLSLSLETSYNTNGVITTGNLFGTSLILSLQNRNAFKQSILTNTNLSGGIELGAGTLIQTVISNFSHTVLIPRIIKIFPFGFLTSRLEEKGYATQTLINVNAGYTWRFDFFTQVSVNGSFGYLWSKVKQKTWGEKTFNVTKHYTWKPINIENTTYPVITDSFQTILNDNPPLQITFRPGLVIGQQFTYNIIRPKGNKLNYLIIDLEQSGALLGFFNWLDVNADLQRFIKGQIEFRHTIDYGRNQLALRAFGGAGLSYGKTSAGYENTLPTFKAFYAGGPNSMRAWQVRNLGLGSSKYYTDSLNELDLRYGDVRLEFNAEYRFLLGTLFGIKFRSALFTDIGNIWNWKPIVPGPEGVGSDFQLDRFYREFAVGAGTGLALDFDYFLIRFDWSYKIHDPEVIETSNDWFNKLNIGSGQLQLGLNYPF